MEKIFSVSGRNYRELAVRDDIIVAEVISDDKSINGLVYFFFVEKENEKIKINDCITFGVKKSRFYEVISESNSKDRSEIDKKFWEHFYRIPKKLRDIIIDIYFESIG